MITINRFYGLFTGLSTLLAVGAFLPPNAYSQTGKLVYQDDFSSSNSVWHFKLLGTQGNQTAIDASYGKIEDGVLKLKGNVGCGWDFLNSVASLQLPLPEDYIVQYRFRKTEWCGPFPAGVWATNELDESVWIVPYYFVSVAGNWFENLNVAFSTNNVVNPPASVPFNYCIAEFGTISNSSNVAQTLLFMSMITSNGAILDRLFQVAFYTS